MSIRDALRVRGSLFSIEALGTLPEDNCNVLIVSDRTLSLIQEFGNNEVTWLTRYAHSFEQGGYYFPVDLSKPDEVTLAENVARNYKLEVRDVSCDVVGAIESLTLVIATQAQGCGCEIGEAEDGESGEEGGDIPQDIGSIEYDDPDPIADRKCKAANWIYFSVEGILSDFVTHDVEGMGLLGLALLVSLIAGIIGTAALGPFGGLIGVVAGLVLGLAVGVLKVGVNLSVALGQYQADEDELICSLYESLSAADARTAFSAALDVAGLSSANKAVVMLMLPNAVLNVLFFATQTSEAFFTSYSGPNDCTSCSLPTVTLSWDQAGGADAGSGDLTADGGSRTLTSVLWNSFHRVHFTVDQNDVNTWIIVKTDPGSMDFPTARLRCDNGSGFDVVWIHDDVTDGLGPAPEIDIFHKGNSLKLTSPDAFAIDFVIGTGAFGVC